MLKSERGCCISYRGHKRSQEFPNTLHFNGNSHLIPEGRLRCGIGLDGVRFGPGAAAPITQVAMMYSKQDARRSRVTSTATAIAERLESRQLLSAVEVTNFRYDISTSGVNSNEVQLTQANVKVGSFGKISATPV